MNFRSAPHHLLAAASILLVGACSATGGTGPAAGNGGATGSLGSAGSASGTAGGSGTTATSGVGAATGGSGSTPGGQAGSTAAAGASGTAASGAASGTAVSGATSGTAASDAGSGGTAPSPDAGTTSADGGDPGDPPPPRPINVTSTGVYQGSFDGQPLYLNASKPIMAKLILVLGGICGGTGGGGIEAFYQEYGFHTFAPKTQTCVNSAPQMYKNIIATMPLDPEANRQVGDARMDLWDGMGRVTWVTVAPGTAIVDETVAALKYATMVNPGGDWSYYLNTDGTLRTTDVWVAGYSWGSQTWAMISSYVRFGRVITTSGPQAEGFPNATWITHTPFATPADRRFMAVGFTADYPSTQPIDIAPNTVTSMIQTTTAAGWIGPPMNVHPGDVGPFMGGQFAMVGSNQHSPGGHTVFCTNDPLDGWIPICQYLFNVQ
jgi:hypothetical protein